MYICICKSLTDKDIHRSVMRGEAGCMDSIRERLGAATGCGRCEPAVRGCLSQALDEKRVADLSASASTGNASRATDWDVRHAPRMASTQLLSEG